MNSRPKKKQPAYLDPNAVKGVFRPHSVSDNTLELTLSATQRDVAALTFGDFARVLGAPQSGKTTALKALFLKLAKEAKPESIMVFTANRTAAATLRDELALSFQGASNGPMARSIPSLAFAILRHNSLMTKSKLPELISGSEQDAMLEELLENFADNKARDISLPAGVKANTLKLSGFRAELRELISVAIEHSVSPAELEALAKSKQMPQWSLGALIYTEYLNELSQAYNTHRYDQASLLVSATELIRQGQVPTEVERLKCILVDDAQELTPAATEFIAALSQRGASVVLFGDPDVATLGFRSADPQAMTRLVSRLAKAAGKEAKQITLHPEHQTHSPEIRAALARVTNRLGTALGGTQRSFKAEDAEVAEKGDSVTAAAFALQGDEHAWLAYQLRKEHLENGVDWRDIAVVARSTQELTELENALAAESVPVRVLGSKSALKNEFGAAQMLQLLEAALSEQAIDYEKARQLLLSPFAGFDEISLRRLRRVLRASEIENGGVKNSKELLTELFESPGSAATITQPVGQQAHSFITLFFELRDLAKTEYATIQDLLWHAYSKTSISKQWPKRSLEVDEVALQISRNLDSVVALFAAAARYVERTPGGSAREFVRGQLELKLPEDSVGVGANLQHRVSLVTPSGLIGRKFKVVAIAHMQEGIWPNLKPRSTLLAANVLDELKRDSASEEVVVKADAFGSEMPGELRMLAKAIGAATDRLYLSAITTEEEQQSQFLELITERALEPSDFDASPLTLRAMAGRLRRELLLETDASNRLYLAAQLLKLAEAGIPGAHPDDWWGVRGWSTTDPLATLGLDAKDKNRMLVSPSQLESFLQCPLHWFINAHGGGDYSFKVQVGNLIHEAFERASGESKEDFMKIVDSKWPLLEFDSVWQERSEERRVAAMVSNLVDYVTRFKTDGAQLIGSEVPFEFEFNGAYVKGTVDRIELRPDGTVRIVDLKTSRYEYVAKKIDEHPQLAAYQLAVVKGGFEKVPQLEAGLPLDGAHLLEVGLDKKPNLDNKIKMQKSFTANTDLKNALSTQLNDVINGMLAKGQLLVANVGTHCQEKHGYSSCSLHLVEQVTYGN